MTTELATAIKDFGFPIVAAMGLGYFVYYVWKWVTTEVKPVLGEAQSTLIKLVDRIRMLDNDMIRLNTKLSMVLEYKDEIEAATGKKLDNDLDDILTKNKSFSQGFDSTGKK
jgi:hypothetical protein|tara:strand:+ start:80 stop:415 length:336 start_codon:yes stop_codon:yes gene_type:complete